MPSEGLPSPFAEAVLDLVAQIPAGRVMSYGDVARVLGAGGPRQVGQAMASYGGGVPWWRVLRADGTPAPMIADAALQRLRLEAVPFLRTGGRVDLEQARWQPGR